MPEREEKDDAGYTDTSDEELLVRRGSVPAEWYSKEPHLGYGVSGEKVVKTRGENEVERLIAAEENPEVWRTVYDELNNASITLSDAQIELLRRIRDRAFVSDTIKNTRYTEEVEVSPFPTANPPLAKRRFTPSAHERLRINKLVHAFKMGWLRAGPPPPARPPLDEFLEQVSDVWTAAAGEARPELPAPKLALPGHQSSYNPAPEFFEQPPAPQTSLRGLAANPCAFPEQFERLMSLYLAPRQLKQRVSMRSRELLPPLPDVEEMRPFPAKCISRANFRQNPLKAVDVSPDGNFLVLVDEFNNVALFHVLLLRLTATLNIVSQNVLSTQFTRGRGVVVFSEEFVDFFAVRIDRAVFTAVVESFAALRGAEGDAGLSLLFPSAARASSSPAQQYVTHCCRVSFPGLRVRSAHLHRGEEFAAFLCAREDGAELIKVLNLAKMTSTTITLRTKTRIERVAFNPRLPQMLVMTRIYLYVYDLKKQERVKRLITGSQTLSCLATHPTGTHLLLGSGDHMLYWYDLEWKDLPYRKMKVHAGAVNACRFSAHFKLFASAGDDGAVVVQYARVDEVGFDSPLICPLKTLRGHKVVRNTGVTDLQFVGPTHWIVSVGYDGNVLVWG